ncbi:MULTISPECIES: carboxypeptidase-like regulatory domain-containing protein [Pirellulaceae]|nr:MULTISPECIES: carboxypeptidase-like regulatory domain-containing protein [Pirellulaceae]
MNKYSWFLSCFICLTSLVAIGCSKGDMPEIGHVSGTVTLDGKPMEGVQVMFEPVDGARSSTAMTDAEGKYVLQYNGNTEGTKTGENLVRLISARGATRDDNGRVTDPGKKEAFPPEYNSSSTQVVNVEGGENVFDFNVTTK